MRQLEELVYDLQQLVGCFLRNQFFFVKDRPSEPPSGAFLHLPDVGHVCPPFWGPPRMQGLRSNSALEKAGVR